MRVTSRLVFLHIPAVVALWTAPLPAQQLPADARPWQLVRTLIQATGSPEDDVDRDAFIERLSGEVAELGVGALKGTWPAYTDVNIDSIISLPPRVAHVPADPEANRPERFDTVLRCAIYVTTYVNGLYDNCYFFCEQDSIWRIESWRQFPTPAQRTTILDQVNHRGTPTTDAFRTRLKLTRLLLNDDDLSRLFEEIANDANRIAPHLAAAGSWDRLDLSRIAFDSIDEYDGLDDELSPSSRLFYRLNHPALRRLQEFGIERIARPEEHADLVLLELGTALGYRTGFMYAPGASKLPYPDKERFFTLKPLTDRWWFYKGKMDEPDEARLPLGPGIHGSGHGKAQLLVPKESGS